MKRKASNNQNKLVESPQTSNILLSATPTSTAQNLAHETPQTFDGTPTMTLTNDEFHVILPEPNVLAQQYHLKQQYNNNMNSNNPQNYKYK